MVEAKKWIGVERGLGYLSGAGSPGIEEHGRAGRIDSGKTSSG